MKEFLATHTVEAVGIIIAAITAVGVFAGPWFASWRHRKKTEEDTRLSVHFEHLKREAQSVISLARGAGNEYGRVEFATSQISDSFKAHFSGEWEEWTKWVEKAEKHNHDYEGFRQKIEKDFESKGIHVKSDIHSQANTCIFTDVFNPLFVQWRELAEGRRPWVDFQKIDSIPREHGYLLYARGWEANVVAFAKSKDEREKCESALAEVAKDEENQGEAAKLNNSANELVEQAKGFADKFAGKLDDIHEFWPGKRTNRFEKLKKICPDCKELF